MEQPPDDDAVRARSPEPEETRDRARLRRQRQAIGVTVLLLAAAFAVVVQRPSTRAIERAGGLADHGGSTSDDRAVLDGVVWSTTLRSHPEPDRVERVVRQGPTTLIVTTDAVWVLRIDRRGVAQELPRLAGLPGIDDDGRLAILSRGRLTLVDALTAEVIERVDVPGLEVSRPTWATPLGDGWAAFDADPATIDPAAAVVVADGASWRIEDVEPTPFTDLLGVTVLQRPGGGLEGRQTTDGTLLWELADASYLGHRPANVLVGVRPDGSVIGIRASDGQVRWRTNPDVAREVVGVVGTSVVVFTSLDPVRLAAISMTSGLLLDEFAPPDDQDGDPIAEVRALGDRLLGLDLQQATVFEVGGTVRWRFSTDGLRGLTADADIVTITTNQGTSVLDARFGDPYIPTLPRAPRRVRAYRPGVTATWIEPVGGTRFALEDGGRTGPDSPAFIRGRVYGVAEGSWERLDGRTVFRDLDGVIVWQTGGNDVVTPVADTPYGIVTVTDDGLLGSVRLVDPATGDPTGIGVLDAGFHEVVPVTDRLLVGRWQDRVTEERWLVAVAADDDGLVELWRSDEAGTVVGVHDETLWIRTHEELVGLELTAGERLRSHALPVISDEVALLDGTAIVLTDDRLHGVRLADGTGWRTPLLDRATTPPLVAGDRVHVGTAGGQVETFSAAGERVDVTDVGDDVVLDIVAVDRRLVVRTSSRLLVLGPS